MGRLPADVYARVKAAGFKWAPKQDLFVAPMWTPGREDLLLELCGEIDDEDKSLVERAEERAERFEEYSDKRASDAEGARKAVAAIADNIPLGQPILVGHHSERRARKDAEKIENGMRRAVKMWETSNYWKERAAGAIGNAKYKERPDVRARRIKTIEADLRKVERSTKDANKYIALWGQLDNAELFKRDGAPVSVMERALYIANGDYISKCFPLAEFPRTPPASQYEGAMSLWSALEGGVITPDQAREIAIRVHKRGNENRARWIAHYENRLAYERAMLAEDGGIPAAQWELLPGGRVLCRGEWATILKVNKRGGQVTSVTTNARYVNKRNVEEIKDYQPPEGDAARRVELAMKLPPMCNYPGEGFVSMTREEWERRQWSDFPKSKVIAGTVQYGKHRVRCTPSKRVQWNSDYVYLTDEKRKDPPAPELMEIGPGPVPAPERAERPAPRAAVAREENDFDKMRESLRAGVQVVSAPQLFPTPPELARQMIELAEIRPGDRVLEPSAGTGALLELVPGDTCRIAVEINRALADRPRLRQLAEVRCADFLQCNGDLGTFDRVLMNPPFQNADDIKHIEHAVSMLKPGGRLVAICANGPRQREKLQPKATEWIDLPPGAFKEAGTGVNTAMLVIEKEA